MNHDIRTVALAAGAAMALSQAVPAAAADARQYYLTDVVVGSMLPQDIVSSSIPFDSPYAALTPAQRAVLAQEYESLAPGDEPPFPLYGVHHMLKPLIPVADVLDPVGPLLAAVDVDAKGEAQAVTIFKSPDPQVARVVSGALALEKYKPALCKGQPCRMQYVLRLDFPQRRTAPVQQAVFHHYDQATSNISGR